MRRLFTIFILSAVCLFAQRPTVFIESSTTADSSNARDKAKHVDFGVALAGALVKKKIPVTVVTDQTKSEWTIRSTAAQREDSTGTKVAKIIAFGAYAGSFTQFEGTIQVIDNKTSGILFAYNIKKSNFQSAAEAFAKHFNNDFLKRRER